MRRFFNDLFIYGVTSVFAKIAAVLLMPFYTNVLTKEDYGAMALIVSCQGIIDLFSNLNLHSGIARDYNEEGIDKRELVSTGFFSIIGNAFLVCIILIFTRNLWTHLLSLQGYETAFLIMLLSIPCGSLFSYFSILTRFKKKPVLYAIGSSLQLLIQVLVTIYLVLVPKIGITGVFIGILCNEIFGIIYFGLINKDFLRFTFVNKLLRRALAFSLPTLPAVLAGWFDSSMGQILIGKYISLEDLGIYSVAMRLASTFTLFSVALANVWNPYLYESYKKENFPKDVAKLFKIIFLILILITINLSLLSKDIILLLSNPGYLAASRYLILLCFPMCIYLLLPFVSSGVAISRRTKYMSYSYVSGSIINILLLFFLLRKYGILIVPISLAISRIVNFIILYTYSQKILFIKYSKGLMIIFIFTVLGCFLLNEIIISRYIMWLTTAVIDILFILILTRKYPIKNLKYF